MTVFNFKKKILEGEFGLEMDYETGEWITENGANMTQGTDSAVCNTQSCGIDLGAEPECTCDGNSADNMIFNCEDPAGCTGMVIFVRHI